MRRPASDARGSSAVQPVTPALERAENPYGTSATSVGIGLLAAGAVLGVGAYTWDAAQVTRSALLGVGLVALSTGATVAVSVLMYRVAPAATAPALALLYLVKVVILGWVLLNAGAPSWLHPRGFALSVAAAVVASWCVVGPVAARAARILGEEHVAMTRARRDEATPAHDPEGAHGSLQDNDDAWKRNTCDQA